MPPPDRSTDRRLLSALLLAAALLVAVLAVAAEADRRQRRQAALEALDHPALAAAERDELTALVARQDDPDEVRLLLSRHLVSRVLDAALPDGAARAAAAERMELARELAAAGWARRPADHRGAAMLGAATYLARSLARDRRLVTESAAWDGPLAAARELAPGAGEPVQLTVTAYLELWPLLSAQKRAAAETLLRRAFDDPGTFARLLAPWLEIAGDRDEAMAVVPDRPDAWRRVADALARRGDAAGFLSAHQRWRDSLGDELDRRLATAARHKRAGKAYDARGHYLRVIADAPLERSFAPRVERALDELPAGQAPPTLAPALARWLRWTLELSLVGRAPLSAAAVDRLAGQVHDLAPPLAAHAAVVAGRLPEGERLERRHWNRLSADAWGGYQVARAGELVRRGQPRDAQAGLDRAGPTWRDRPSYLLARAEAARAAGDHAEEETALTRLAAVGWSGGAWLDGRAELWLAEPVDGLVVRGRRRPAGGPTLVELRLDGHRIAAERLRGEALRVLQPISPGPHLLEVVQLTGQPFLPAAVTPLGGPPA